MNSKIYLITFAIIITSLTTSCISDTVEPAWSLEVGDTLPYFSVTTLDGGTVSSADSYHQELVIVFFNTGCKDCREELPRLQQSYKDILDLPENNRPIYICISREEGATEIAKYWEDNNLTLPVAAQNDRELYSKFATSGIPRIYKAKGGVITYASTEF